nr:tryptophan 2,3-dioxygenase family protein [Nocardioides thalensis]
MAPGVDLAAPTKTHLPTPAPQIRDWLELTVQPVSTVHDEHFFIRALQAHEMAFTAMNRDLRDAIAAIRARDLDLAASLLDEVVAFMDRNASLFRMVATMRPEAFHAFRQFTDGASAIQSEQYKRFEGLCGTPPAARLASPAFASVPAVRAEILAGQDTLTDAYREAVGRGRRPRQLAAIADLIQSLEASHRRWKTTHVTLASRMLGDARGSGHTSGVDYLRTWVDHRLFWQLPELAGVDGARRSA